MYDNRGPRQDYEVTCSECGVQTTVPFKPTEGRPVKCRDCFAKGRPPRGAGGFGDRPPRREGGGGGGGFGGDRGERQYHDATCTRCGVQTQVPFKPTPGRDVLCRDCFRGARQ